MGVDDAEWHKATETLGRIPTHAELGVISVMWSEHCSYKSSRLHLRRLPSTGPQVVQGPGENAGAVDIGDGYCAVFKIESHNHPSFIEPYQGAATGVGGILRDVFTMGARPVALLNGLRFGDEDHALTPRLAQGVVAGIAGYGNAFGVPTVGGDCQFASSYNGNILVNAFALGVAKSDELFFGRAANPGSRILYVGSPTGRDGIHGATMASKEFDESSHEQRPTVQVGDPFAGKRLLEACLEIFAANCLLGVQDMGAAGLTSSSVEMAARALTGVDINLDQIPRRTHKMSPYELLLSESQERMLMVSKPGEEQQVYDICRRWEVEVADIGCVTDTRRFVCRATLGYDPTSGSGRPNKEPVVVVDLPVDLLAEEAPRYDRPQAPASPEAPATALSFSHSTEELRGFILGLVGSCNLGSRQRIWQQYDHIVRNGTVVRPGEGDAAVIRVVTEAGPKYLAMALDGNGRHVQADPFAGAAMAVAEACRNVACTGAKPLGLTDCMNFGSADNPETMWHFSRAIDGIRAASLALDAPVVSGNVSLYNETDGSPIWPTPVIVAVGLLPSIENLVRPAFAPGTHFGILGQSSQLELGSSEWASRYCQQLVEASLAIDLDHEQRVQRLLQSLTTARLLSSAHDVSDGGLSMCIIECCMQGGIGCRLERASSPTTEWLFSETPGRVVVGYAAESEAEIASRCRASRVPFEPAGQVMEASGQVNFGDGLSFPLVELQGRHEAALDRIF